MFFTPDRCNLSELTLSCEESRFAGNSSISKENTYQKNSEKTLNFPEPFKDETTIQLKFDENLVKILKIRIFDIQGKLVSELMFNSKTLKIGKDLLPGLYFYKITGENYVPHAGKMVKIK